MSKKNIVLKSAKKAFSKELNSIKTLSSIFNDNFYKVVETIHNTKGRVILTGVGKSAHIGNKISGSVFCAQRVIILVDDDNIYQDVDHFLDERKGNVFSIIYGSMEGHKDRIHLIQSFFKKLINLISKYDYAVY